MQWQARHRVDSLRKFADGASPHDPPQPIDLVVLLGDEVRPLARVSRSYQNKDLLSELKLLVILPPAPRQARVA